MVRKKNISKVAGLLLLFMMSSIMLSVGAPMAVKAETKMGLTVHYQRQDMEGWNIWLWEEGKDGAQYDFDGEDEFGAVAKITLDTDSSKLGFILRKGDFQEKDGEGDRFISVKEGATEVWLKEGDPKVYKENPTLAQASSSPAGGDIRLKVHYRRFDESYEGWNLWLWPDGKDGEAFDFIEKDDFGAVLETILTAGDSEKFGFIIRKGEWEAKDVDEDRFVALDDAVNGVLEIYLLEKDGTIYFDQDEVDLSPKILKAELTGINKLNLGLSVPKALVHDQNEGVKVMSGDGELVNISTIYFMEGGRPESSSQLEVLFEDPLDFGKDYTVLVEGYGEKAIALSGVFGTKAFENQYHYEGELGALYEKDQTTFRVWSPMATTIMLNLFESGDGGEATTEIPMARKDKGIWEAVVTGDQNKMYYTYAVDNKGETKEAVDPYARAVGVNGMRAMVVDLSMTNPEGWEQDKKPELKSRNKAVIYELHVRDLSISEDSGITNKGKFLGLTEEGTKGPGGVSTGLDHIKEMGITHLHLLPSFDFRSIDETKLEENNYNWGYDPQHFNVPEGSYSTDPYHGEVRIKEYKEMVQTLHENDIRVIMDVVYNHTGASSDSDFSKIVPGYYYRFNEDGTFSNGSGTGNETASERSMMRRFMVDSVVYWAKEYGIDGFRFDLMGLHDIETMKEIRTALDEIDPTILIYGEGWTGGDSPLPDKEKALKKNIWRIDGVAAFSDDVRDALKGHVFTDEDQGFVSGAEGLVESMKFGIVASLDHPGVNYEEVKYSSSPWAKSPNQTISYVEAHDNLTLWDKLLISNPEASEEERMKMHKLANATILTSQGIPFLHAGSEFYRTKDGDHNSYKSPDSVNELDWSRKEAYRENVDYFKGLITLRKEHPAFRMETAEDVKNHLEFLDLEGNQVLGYTLNGGAVNDSWQNITVLLNGDNNKVMVNLEEGNYQVVVNGEKSGVTSLSTVDGKSVEVQAKTLMVLVKGESLKDSHGNLPGAPESYLLFYVVMAIGTGLLGYGFYLRKKNKTS